MDNLTDLISTLIAKAVMGLVLIPFSLIWALNTLFGLGIELSWSTWFAAFVLMLIIQPWKSQS